MSLLGKIFVVVVTILSLLFLGVTGTLYSHSNDWRQAYSDTVLQTRSIIDGQNRTIRSLQEERTGLRSTVTTAEEAVRLHKGEIRALEDVVKRQTREQSELRSNHERLQSTHDTLARTVSEKDSQIAQYLDRIRHLEGELTTASSQKERAETQVARLLAQRTALEKDLSEVREEYVRAKQQALDLQLVIEELERIGIPVGTVVANYEAVPPLRGLVAGVDTSVQPSLVLLSIGQEDGVKRGYQFTVYRGDKFIGQVVVSRLMADSAGCRVLFTAPGETIRAGDHVATRLE